MDTEIRLADFSQQADRLALQLLMQEYASDPMGGGQPLSSDIVESLPDKLHHYPGAFSVIAWSGEKAVGLINCFETLSTFKARPLVNIHDVIVSKSCRGKGISHQMLERVEVIAKDRGCCKLTLEVLQGNERARQVYLAFGFAGYELDEAFGKALFWEKAL
ncbi:GNAT family N-acetyltransferase [Pseudomaricurvus sp.]|uniref:GNAT family N-acetyltransferase n=1 Tax=Pseudomaricurvus sp. TaxID=2004510 RepID=UPI003F6D62C0